SYVLLRLTQRTPTTFFSTSTSRCPTWTATSSCARCTRSRAARAAGDRADRLRPPGRRASGDDPGFAAHLPKPLTVERLLDALREVLPHEARRPPGTRIRP
ncbi:MAG: hypothetical protein MZW92_29530, partial [Comamonadaceae bacterium]|nr:hypothetical protein [Comamonadaceae bacterium]